MTTRQTKATGQSSARRQVRTVLGVYGIYKPRGERAEVYRPSGMLVGRYNTLPEANVAAYKDAAALTGRY